MRTHVEVDPGIGVRGFEAFTPYGDANLLRMANLYANVCHVARPDDL